MCTLSIPYKTLIVEIQFIKQGYYHQMFMGRWNLGKAYTGWGRSGSTVTFNGIDYTTCDRDNPFYNKLQSYRSNYSIDITRKITAVLNAYYYKGSMLGETKIVELFKNMGVEARIA